MPTPQIPSAVPTADMIREQLKTLSGAQIQKLADLSGVMHRSLWKIRSGETKNPGIDTVGKFLPHIKAVKRLKAA